MKIEMLPNAEATAGPARSALFPDPAPDPDATTISCFENEVPEFVSAELERLYENPHSSLAHLKVRGSLKNANTYVVSKGCEIVTIFLFLFENGKVDVLNEAIRIGEEDIWRFASYIFATFLAAKVIRFRAIQTTIRNLPFSFQKLNYLEDIVLNLPKSPEDYRMSLGKETRRVIRRYMKRIQEDFSSFKIDVYEAGAIQDQHVHDIVQLNRARMSEKNKTSAYDDEETGKILDLARHFGMVVTATVDGKMCAGALIYRIGSNYFLIVSAHDSTYNAYRLGTLCCYFSICECIARGGKEFHFLWGRYPYKYLLLGARRDLDYLAIFRTPLQTTLHGGMIVGAWYRAGLRQVRLWLQRAVHGRTFAARLIVVLLSVRRRLKQW